ncbi:hypothetical protein HMPREF0083_02034 [Aneurinibacillus aneurinilyticus ATCC 12856]|uniref:Uncharacterized protein n=1 Tax=Aneurinibacillus aneurinilyticus ATCC 12856 TaxID=649747 RepID=U1X4H2_ANEAE|nr:hypothetical protein HMPREF0083_02034 [Aneurinibacillus aneurinilyticus ATCC 12856]
MNPSSSFSNFPTSNHLTFVITSSEFYIEQQGWIEKSDAYGVRPLCFSMWSVWR